MIMENLSKIRDFFGVLVQKHIETYKDDFERDFIDVFLKEKKRRENSGNPQH